MRTVTLGDVADWGSGGTPNRGTPAYFGAGVPWLSIADLDDGVVHEAKESLTALGIANSSAKVVPAGTIFVAMYGSIGKLGVAGQDMCSSQAIAFARPRGEVVDTRYLFRYLLSQRDALRAAGRGGTQMNIGQGDLKKWPIPLPSVHQQRRIAAILDHADGIRSKRREVHAHLEGLNQSIFQNMFGDHQAITQRWDSISLGEGLTFLTSGSRGWARHYSDFGDKFLRIQNVRRDELLLNDLALVRAPLSAEARRTQVRPGDVLLSITADLGRTAVIPDDIGTAFISQHLSILRAPAFAPQFLSAFLTSPAGRGQILGKNRAAVKAGLNFDDIRSLKIPVPPISLQRQFADRASHVAEQRATRTQQDVVYDAMFDSLQARAFQGEL